MAAKSPFCLHSILPLKCIFYAIIFFRQNALHASKRVWCFKSECLLRFSLVLRSKCINQKKLNVKTLSRPYTKRTHQRRHSKMCHLGMVDEQTQGVKLGISNIANYNSSWKKDLRCNIMITPGKRDRAP